MLLFAVIAALILFGSQYLSTWLFPQAPAPAHVEAAQTGAAAPKVAGESPATLRDRAQVIAATPRVAIETPNLRGSINLKGARIDDLELIQYDQTVEKNSPRVQLLTPSGAADARFANFGWQGQNLQVPGPDTVWQASGAKLTPTTPVTLTTTNASGQRFTIEYSIDSDFMFTIRQSVENAGAAPVTVTPYALVSRLGRSTDIDQYAAHVGPMVVSGGAATYANYGDVEKGPKAFTTTGGWAGFTDHYWLTAVIPDQKAPVQMQLRATPSGDTHQFQADFQLASADTIQPGRKLTRSSQFFAGAKEVKLLEHYESQGIVQFDKAIDWGWFAMIEKPIFYYLDWLFRMVGNFGLAIILLTLTIRLLLFPLAQRQFASMAGMRVLQPKMKALQERYKDDKPRLQQEMMQLYKEEKVNPLAGCLPILLQIPIMFALYKVLLLTIEMRHQPFVLWIRDLSAPDPANLVNFAGLFGLSLPHMLAIGVIPLLLGVSMFFQMRLNPAPMDEMQKQVFAFMPWVLMFVMAPFAVGLQIYWITSNFVTILQQQWLYSRHPVLKQKPEAAAKEDKGGKKTGKAT